MTDTHQPPRLFIATPCYGGNLHYQYVVSLFQLSKYLDKVNIGYTVSFLGNESLITRARNIMVGKFLTDSSCTHLLFIDADIQFSVRSVLRLLEVDKDVCFGVYPSKSFHFDDIKHLVNSCEDASGLKSLCLNYMLSYDLDSDNNITVDPEKKLIKVKYGTTGFMMIKRAVLDKMITSYPNLQYHNEKTCKVHNIRRDKLFLLFDCIKEPETNDYLSEDFSFSYLWRKLDGEIWADMESKLSHWGNYQFQGDLQAYLNAKKVQHKYRC
jgi:hypothetical protein